MFNFNADVSKVLNIVINSLYKEKDVFLREIISNASDACEKRRFELLKNQQNYEGKIEISINEEEKTITISDNGIGMSEEELHKNLSTIGHSGTSEFKQENPSLEDIIGQFGVGFYSGFMVAKRMTVLTKKEDQAFLWSSDGSNGYEIKDGEKSEIGTLITIFLKDTETEYLNHFSVENIIKTYSSNISTNIFFKNKDSINTCINSSPKIWTKQKSQTTKDEYEAFYKSCYANQDEPFIKIHSKLEGDIEFYALIFAPTQKPFNLFHPDRLSKIKLYSRGVYIPDAEIEILPRCFRFFHGVIDCVDLPLNVSRDTIQSGSVVRKIKKAITKKVIHSVRDLMSDEAKYDEFWDKYGNTIKEGICENEDIKEELLSLVKFQTNTSDSLKTFDEYMESNKDQNEILYVSSDKKDDAINAPEMEKFNNLKKEVILFTDPIDTFWLSITKTYKSKVFKSVKDAETEADKDENKDDKKIIDFFVKSLKSKISAVKTTTKLIDSPACVSIKGDGLDIRMERILFEQKQIPHKRAKIFEINQNHPAIKSVIELSETDPELAEKKANVIYELALISSGDVPEKPAIFIKDLYLFLK